MLRFSNISIGIKLIHHVRHRHFAGGGDDRDAAFRQLHGQKIDWNRANSAKSVQTGQDSRRFKAECGSASAISVLARQQSIEKATANKSKIT